MVLPPPAALLVISSARRGVIFRRIKEEVNRIEV